MTHERDGFPCGNIIGKRLNHGFSRGSLVKVVSQYPDCALYQGFVGRRRKSFDSYVQVSCQGYFSVESPCQQWVQFGSEAFLDTPTSSPNYARLKTGQTKAQQSTNLNCDRA